MLIISLHFASDVQAHLFNCLMAAGTNDFFVRSLLVSARWFYSFTLFLDFRNAKLICEFVAKQLQKPIYCCLKHNGDGLSELPPTVCERPFCRPTHLVCVCVWELSLECFQVNEGGQSCLQRSRKELILLLKADSCGFNGNLPHAG